MDAGKDVGKEGEKVQRLVLAQVSLVAKVMRSRMPPMDGEMMQLEVRPFARGAVQGTFSGAVDQGWLALAAIWLTNK